MDDRDSIKIFDQYRQRLFGLAYRMLGTRDDAEDIVQETYIRWHNADRGAIKSAEAWLVTAATRLSIDRLRKASRDRQSYIGPWLPEPIMISPEPSPQENAELASDLSLAFMVLLERLSPTERAVFLLHDVFDCDYTEIARILDRSEAAIRQMNHRARERVRTDRVRYQANDAERVRLMKNFVAASVAGDTQQVISLLAPDVTLTSDGGGKVSAARKIVTGAKRVGRVFYKTGPLHRERVKNYVIDVNGEKGVLTLFDGEPAAITTFDIVDGQISGIYRVMNPEKLAGFSALKNSAETLSQI
jgi:RNA polymerase sigma-70 factor (ECF subfamily)